MYELHDALDLLAHERFAAAHAILSALAPTPQVRWWVGASLHGQNRHAEALDALRSARRLLHDDVDRCRCAIDIAITHNKRGQPRMAERLLRICARMCAARGWDDDLLKCQLYLAITRARRGLYAEFLDAYAGLAPQLAQAGDISLRVIGLVTACASCVNLGRYDQARSCYATGIALARQSGLVYREALFETYRFRMAFELGDASWSDTDSDALELLAQQSGALLLINDCRTYRSQLAYRNGDLAEATRQSQLAFEAFTQMGYADGAAVCQTNIGLFALAVGRYDRALHALSQSEALAIRCGSVDTCANARLLTGWTHALLASHDVATFKLRQAADAFSEHGFESKLLQAYVLLASTDHAHAHEWLRRADAMLEGMAPSAFWAEAHLWLSTAALRHTVQDARAHLSAAHTAFGQLGYAIDQLRCELPLLALDLVEDESRSISILKRAEALADLAQPFPELECQRLLIAAQCLMRMDEMRRALALLRQAAALAGEMRGAVLDPALSGRVAGLFADVFAVGQTAALVGREPTTAVALAVTRRDTAWRRKRQMAAPINQSLDDYAELVRASQQLRLASTRMLNAIGLSATASHEGHERLLRERTQQRARQQSFEAEQMARLAAHAANPALISTPAVVDSLRERLSAQYGKRWTAVLIEPARMNDNAWITLHITGDRCWQREMRSSPEIRHAIRMASEPAASWRSDVYRAAGRSCAVLDTLGHWMRIDEWVGDEIDADSVVLLGDSPPFAAMACGAFKLASGKTLAERALLVHISDWLPSPQPSNQNTGRVLVVAPLSFEQRHAAIPESANEVAEFRKLWPSCDVLQGQGASTTALRALSASGKLADYELIYFATHGCFVPDAPSLSALALADDDVGALEIANWTLNAQCVVVGACESSRTTVLPGNERFGLEASLIAAGARHVAGALWPVLDADAGAFAVRFAQAYHSGASVARAFAVAQRQALAANANSDWAAWRLSGIV